jgi:hypothetical protein
MSRISLGYTPVQNPGSSGELLRSPSSVCWFSLIFFALSFLLLELIVEKVIGINGNRGKERENRKATLRSLKSRSKSTASRCWSRWLARYFQL